MARIFVRPDVVYRTGIPMPFSIAKYRPNAQVIPSFRKAYGEDVSLNGAFGNAMAATSNPVVTVILNDVRSAAQGRPNVIQRSRKAIVQDALSALLRGRTR